MLKERIRTPRHNVSKAAFGKSARNVRSVAMDPAIEGMFLSNWLKLTAVILTFRCGFYWHAPGEDLSYKMQETLNIGVFYTYFIHHPIIL